jgi:tetratricopeptide (TPR) repeat protein
MAAVALCVAVYGLLYAASWSTQSPVDRLAAMDVSTDVIEGYQTRVRSPMPQASADTTPDDLYLRALPLLRDARTSTLGLFPHFDLRKLSEAESLLQRVVDRTEPGSFLQLEAYFYLGKINLAQGEVETARTQFKKVVRREGRRAESAYQILKELEEVRPVGGGTASASLL